MNEQSVSIISCHRNCAVTFITEDMSFHSYVFYAWKIYKNLMVWFQIVNKIDSISEL